MKFRLAARLEFLALTALGAAVAGCAGAPVNTAGHGYAWGRSTAPASIADARIPSERIIAVAEVFEKQGNHAKAEELYAHVDRTKPQPRAEAKSPTRVAARQRDSQRVNVRMSAEPREENLARREEILARREENLARREAQEYAEAPVRRDPVVRDESVSRSAQSPRRDVVRKASLPKTKEPEYEEERPSVETWATLKLRVSDARSGTQRKVRPSVSESPEFVQDTSTHRDSDEDVDGWKTSDARDIPEVKIETEEEEAPREARQEVERVDEDRLVGLLKSEDPHVRRTVALHISQIGLQAIDLLRPLREALHQEPVYRTRTQLAEAILRVSPRDVEAYRVLLKSASDPNNENAAVARVMLSAHVARNTSIVESQSEQMLKDNDPDVRSAAKWSLVVANKLRSDDQSEVQQVRGFEEHGNVRPALAIRPGRASQ